MKKELIFGTFLLYAGINQILHAQQSIEHIVTKQDSINIALNNLMQELLEDGYDIKPFLSDNKYKLHKNVKNYFETAPEKIDKKKDFLTLKEIEEYYALADTAEVIQMFKSYSKIFVPKIKLKAPFFIAKYKNDLLKIETKKVSAGLITSTLGIESRFKLNAGRDDFKAFNALVSINVMDKLDNFLRITKRTNWKEYYSLELKALLDMKDYVPIFSNSSYCGAIGALQFMPQSIKQYLKGNNLFEMESVLKLVVSYYEDRWAGNVPKSILRYNNSSKYMLAVSHLTDYFNETYFDKKTNYFEEAIPIAIKRINNYREIKKKQAIEEYYKNKK